MFPWPYIHNVSCMLGCSGTTTRLGHSCGDADDVIRASLWVWVPEAPQVNNSPSEVTHTDFRGVNCLTNSHRGSLSHHHCHYVQSGKARILIWFNEHGWGIFRLSGGLEGLRDLITAKRCRDAPPKQQQQGLVHEARKGKIFISMAQTYFKVIYNT